MYSPFDIIEFWEVNGKPVILATVKNETKVFGVKMPPDEVHAHGARLTEKEYDLRYGVKHWEVDFIHLKYHKKQLSDKEKKQMNTLEKLLRKRYSYPCYPVFEYRSDEGSSGMLIQSSRLRAFGIGFNANGPYERIAVFTDYTGADVSKEEFEYRFNIDAKNEVNKKYNWDKYPNNGVLFWHYKNIVRQKKIGGNINNSLDIINKACLEGRGSNMSADEFEKFYYNVLIKYPPKRWWQFWKK